MNLTNTIRKKQSSSTLLTDGFVRLSKSDLNQITFEHLDSGLYHDVSEHKLSTNRCSLKGYTEWVGLTTPMVSLSWDWQWVPSPRGQHYKIIGLPFSNILLQDLNGHDYLLHESEAMLLAVVKNLPWVPEIEAFTTTKYS